VLLLLLISYIFITFNDVNKIIALSPLG